MEGRTLGDRCAIVGALLGFEFEGGLCFRHKLSPFWPPSTLSEIHILPIGQVKNVITVVC
jgi:hypothetical protein